MAIRGSLDLPKYYILSHTAIDCANPYGPVNVVGKSIAFHLTPNFRHRRSRKFLETRSFGAFIAALNNDHDVPTVGFANRHTFAH